MGFGLLRSFGVSLKRRVLFVFLWAFPKGHGASRGMTRVWTEALARSLPLWHKQKKGLSERRDAL